MRTLVEFVEVYAEFRPQHPRRRALWLAWQIVFKGTPF